ncbi:major capsid protein [Escherichia phage vB_EcoP_YF01]|uniref:Major capsid protein n=1 Tax=Escherichia phage vB_EcoP_YF01 TaxID=3017283 RepID=A0AAE9VTK6_9CAUD|nr:major capsid protein [Escherichia phage vB_EcoP_YF01]
MANPTLFVSYDQNGKKLSFANWISVLSPQDTPFVSMTGKESINQTIFSWQTDALASVDANNAHVEGSRAVDGEMQPTVIKSNVTQILRKVVKVSDTANTTANYGRGRELMYQLEKKGKEIKRDLEKILLSGQARTDVLADQYLTNSATDPATVGLNDGHAARKTGAFQFLCAHGGLDGAVVDKTKNGPADPDTGAVTVKVAQNASNPTTNIGFDEADIFDMTLQLYTAGSEADIIMINPAHAKIFAGLQENTQGSRKRIFENTKQFIYEVNSITDPLGQSYKIIVNRWMPTDAVYFFRSADWTQMVLRAPKRTELAKDGSYEKWMIEMEVGLRHRNPYASGVLFTAAGKGSGGVTVDTVTVSPSSVASLLTGATQQFTATAEMSDGSTSTTGFSWSVEGGGAVSVSGLYTAPSTSQETPATITATKGGKKGTATIVKVIDPAMIASKGPITGKIGGNTTEFTTMFTATHSTYSDYNFAVTPTSAGTVNGSGVFVLDNNASGTVTVKATHKTQTSVTATTSFTGVVAKASIQSKGPVTTALVGGDAVAFTTMFTPTNSTASDYTVTIDPTANGTYSSGSVTLSASASGSTVVTATHKTQPGVVETCTLSNITPKATLTGKTVTGKMGEDTVTFAEMFTSNKPASEFSYVVTPSTNASVNVNTGLLTLTNNASGNYAVKATHKVQTSVTATANVNGVVPKPDIRASELPPQVGGSQLNFGVMFLFGNSSPSDYTVTITPAEAGTVDPTDGDVTLALDPGDELISVKAVHKTIPSVQATCSFTATPKLLGLVASQVTNTVVVGDPENPLATDTITITDSAQPGVVRFDSVPQGAIVGKLVYDVEGTDASLMELSLSGQVLTITLSAPITSEDTKVTVRTDPGSNVFRTYIVKSGA